MMVYRFSLILAIYLSSPAASLLSVLGKRINSVFILLPLILQGRLSCCAPTVFWLSRTSAANCFVPMMCLSFACDFGLFRWHLKWLHHGTPRNCSTLQAGNSIETHLTSITYRVILVAPFISIVKIALPSISKMRWRWWCRFKTLSARFLASSTLACTIKTFPANH